jgi:hypothetical protein
LVVPPAKAVRASSTAHTTPRTTCRRDKPANLIFIVCASKEAQDFEDDHGSSLAATSLLNPHLPRPHSTIRLHLSHERDAIADRERHFVLAISDMHEKVGAGIIIEFEQAVTGLVLKFHTNAELHCWARRLSVLPSIRCRKSSGGSHE